MPGRSERRTVKALRQGSREAYVHVIDAHYRSVYRFLLLLARDPHAAEDMTQEVFASAWAAIGGFRGEASLRTWLHRIAYNTFLDGRRRSEREGRVTAAVERREAEVAVDPAARIVADERQARVLEALGHLEADERAILILHYIEGRSYREMARVLGRSSGTLKWMTSRALKKVRQRLTGKVAL